jgi:hypothetical protein
MKEISLTNKSQFKILYFGTHVFWCIHKIYKWFSYYLLNYKFWNQDLCPSQHLAQGFVNSRHNS